MIDTTKTIGTPATYTEEKIHNLDTDIAALVRSLYV